jgi:eukaryotic-like serine/threonine-protein kinase
MHRRGGIPVLILVVAMAAGCASTVPPSEAVRASPVDVTASPMGAGSPSPVVVPGSPVASPSIASEAPPACTAIGQTWVARSDGRALVCVPAATGLIGAPADDPAARSDAQPRHEVQLSAFWIDRTEVTNAAYERCVDAQQCPPRPPDPGTTGVASKTRTNYYWDPAFADYPVLIYTPEEAAAYCTCMGRRLPTEAEWERAAGGTDGRRYPWGDALDCDHASYLGCTADTTQVDVPASGASPYGALNLAGNVAEWVSDRYAEDYYAVSPRVDPTGPATGEVRVRRGGGFASLPHDLLVSTRISGNPAHYFDGQMGFRCAAGAGGSPR